jgi:hypothetical protein
MKESALSGGSYEPLRAVAAASKQAQILSSEECLLCERSGSMAARIAEHGRAEICREPCVAGLTTASPAAARRDVSIGKKRVGRALHAPV